MVCKHSLLTADYFADLDLSIFVLDKKRLKDVLTVFRLLDLGKNVSLTKITKFIQSKFHASRMFSY